ncbi:proactivator polypeptide-like 1 [Suncus etruscus]|uniref:proactivator polypeptide-like 1 n=1 Tax=Suncus etruscus TaxID=109475 RepID=UPI00210F37A4|nr:proactivator polypeptide-like 1 [Suncus etruscus]
MLGALLLLLGLLGASLAGPIPSPQECAQGTAVWCRDLQSAAACGAVEHCRGAVWSRATAKSLPCLLCQDVVEAARNGMNPDATDSDELALLGKVCEWLPKPASVAKCQQMVTAQSSAVLGLLRDSPGSALAQACVALTLCQPLQQEPVSLGSFDWGEQPEGVVPFLASGALRFHPQQQNTKDTACHDCIGLMTRLQVAAGSNLPAVAVVSAQEECMMLGPGMAPLCKIYIRHLLARAEPMLADATPRQICFRGGFCERPEVAVPRAQAVVALTNPALELAPATQKRGEVQMQSGVTCEVCLQVVQKLDQWLESNSTTTMISHALERVCSFMPRTITQQCVMLVDTYSPSLLELISRIKPDQVCHSLHLCTGRRRARALLEDYRVHREHGAHATTTMSPLEELENQGSFCSPCKKLMLTSTQNLDRKSTKRDILMAFKGGCSLLPPLYKFQCNHFVTNYEPVLIESLHDVMEPDALCKKIGACHLPRTPLGTDQCVLGPSFWCRSPELAEMCNATEHCQRHMWKDKVPGTGRTE